MKYARVVQYVLETPWAMHPTALAALVEILTVRADGKFFTDDEIADRISAAQAAQRQPSQSGMIAVLPLYGQIFPRANLFTEMSGGTSLQKWAAQFKELDASPKVGHIVLDIASPGGSVDLVPETADLIRDSKTPVTAVANAQAASAAYWLASQADELVVTPSGQVGSIGVWSAHEDFSRADKNDGIEVTLVSAGKYKVEGNPWEPLGEEARAAMQADVDAYYDMFTAAVAKGRGTTALNAAGPQFGEGRMVLAQDAVRRGMADRVASLDDVIDGLRSGSSTVATARSDDTEITVNIAGPLPDPDEFARAVLDSAGIAQPEPEPEPEPGGDPEDDESTAVSIDLSNPRHRDLLRGSSHGDRSPSLAGGETEKGGLR